MNRKPFPAFRPLFLAAAMGCFALWTASARGQFLSAQRIAAVASWPEGEPNIGLALDTNDNCFVAGYFDGTNDFGGVTLTNQSSGGPDIFLAKYDSTGNLQWVRQAGGTTVNCGRAVGLDAAGNIYMTGSYSDSANFGDTNLPAGSGEQFFLAKYDMTGALEWVEPSTGGNDYNSGIGLTVDSAGNSYALAVLDHSGTSITFGSVTVTANNGGTTFLILVKYDGAGNAQWAQLFDTSQETYGSKVAVDAAGNVYVRGLFESDLTIGATHLSGNAAKNAFVAKFDGAGNLVWIRQPTGGGVGEGGVVVDPAGNVYISGAFTSTLNFGGGVSLKSTASHAAPFGDAFLAKYNSAGAIKWALAAGGTSGGFYWDIVLDAHTNIYAAGFLGYEAIVARYGPAGIFQSICSATGSRAAPVSSGVTKCAVDPLGNCYLAGFYQGKVAFGTGRVLQPLEAWNFFLAQASPAYATLSVDATPPGAGSVNPNRNGLPLPIGGRYSMAAVPAPGCRFIGWTGSTNSGLAGLTFSMEPDLSFTANFADVTRPVVAVLYPKANQTVTNPVITATGRAKDNVGVTAVYCQVNTNDWTLATGGTNWSTGDLPLNLGTNVIRARAVDAAGNISLTNSITFRYMIPCTGVYVGQTNDNPSGPGGFALFVDAHQHALLVGGDPYNDDSGNALFGSCAVDLNGNGNSDINSNQVSFAIFTNGSVDVAVESPWQWEITGNLVSGGPFRAAAGSYSATVSGQTIQGVLSPDGWFYSTSPHHNGGGRCQFPAYGQPVTEMALGHSVATLTLHLNATISATVTNNNIAAVFTMTRVDPLPIP